MRGRFNVQSSEKTKVQTGMRLNDERREHFADQKRG